MSDIIERLEQASRAQSAYEAAHEFYTMFMGPPGFDEIASIKEHLCVSWDFGKFCKGYSELSAEVQQLVKGQIETLFDQALDNLRLRAEASLIHAKVGLSELGTDSDKLIGPREEPVTTEVIR